MKKVTLRLAGEPADEEAVSAAPVWLALGFRPFFLLAASFGCVAMLVWLHALFSGAQLGSGALSGPAWHAHEMVFGFAMAVVAGFLLTASRNWTGLDTLHGHRLLALACVWVAGRMLMSPLFAVPGLLVALIVVAFPVGLAVAVGRVIVAAGSRRNYGILGILGLLVALHFGAHAEAFGLGATLVRASLYGAVHLVVLLTVVIGGRIIPLFTRNKTGAETRAIIPLDRAVMALTGAVGGLAIARVAGVAGLDVPLAVAAITSGALHILRMRTWGTLAGLRVPMLAVLHVGYLWVPAGHLLLAAAALGSAVTDSMAMHALTIGVIGVMTLGMMARVSMGHTGREIRAGRMLSVAFVAMNLAAIVRLAGVLLPDSLRATWLVAGALFAAALLGLLLKVGPWLVVPREDGKPG